MMRVALCLSVLLPVIAVADLKSDFQVKYSQLDHDLATKNIDAAEKWIDENTVATFTYTSRDKNKYALAAFKKGLRDQVAITTKVLDSGVKVTSATLSGSQLIVLSNSHTTARVAFDGKPMKLVDKSSTKDVWVKVGKSWKMKSSVQTGGSTQMYQEEGP